MNTSLSTKQLQWRYATKKFDSEQKISEQKLDIIKESFNLTATSYGLQPIKLIVVSNKDIQESLVAQSWNQRQVADASHLLIFCIEKKLSAEYIKTYFERVKDIRNTPDEIIKPFQKFLIEDFEKGKYLYVKEDLTQLNKEKCRWGLSKDDVTPAQIFLY